MFLIALPLFCIYFYIVDRDERIKKEKEMNDIRAELNKLKNNQRRF